MRTMSRYLYCNRIKGGKKMYTCKSNLVPMLYRGGKKKLGKKKSTMAKKKKEEEEEDFLEEF